MAASINSCSSGGSAAGIGSTSTPTPPAGTVSRDKECLWYFTSEQLANSPSRRHGIDADQELSYRQLTAYLIQEMGQRLQVSQLCINTAIVYMHRFYAFHSFTHFYRNGMAAASLFLAAKVEEQPRKLEYVIKVQHICLNLEAPQPSSEAYAEQAQDLVFNENVLLQTLGFDVAIDHPHTHVVKTCHLVKACKDLAQTSYFLASNSLHLTSMCLQYRPTVVACFCIYLACKWSRWEIPQSTEGKHWFHYVDKEVTMDLLKQLTDEFIAIYEKSPARLKSKLNSIRALAQGARISEPNANGNGSTASATALQLDQQQQLLQAAAQARRSEAFSGHHRPHHASSSASSHHHSKPVNETGDHKPVPNHKPMYPMTQQSNRPPPRSGDVNPTYPLPSHSGKQMPPPPASTAASTNLPFVQRHHAHHTNYPKPRPSLPAQSSPPLSTHKLVPKQESGNRNLLKDSSSSSTASGRMVDAKPLPNKMYPPPSIPPTNQSGNIGLDMTRNMLHGSQRASYLSQSANNSSQQTSAVPPPSYNQSVPNLNNYSKYEQQTSVQQLLPKQKHQPSLLEMNFNATTPSSNLNSRQVDDSINRHHQINDQMEICSPPKYSQYPAQLPLPPAFNQPYQQTTYKNPSIFSPEWNDKIPTTTNQNNQQAFSNSKLPGYKSSSRDSPKKERKSADSLQKKEKSRSSSSTAIPDNGQSNIGTISNEKRQSGNHQASSYLHKKSEPSSSANYINNKRIIDEELSSRELKVRKVEAHDRKPFVETGGSIDSKHSKPNYPPVNGIETNPDLVSILLKQSLVPNSSTSEIKTEPGISPNKMEIDHEADIKSESNLQMLQPQTTIIKEEIKVEPGDTDDGSKLKSEKKKKKEKHKHKEKDKSKDKEEKKKHKKDKEKDKEKEKEKEKEKDKDKDKDKDKHKERDRLSGTETADPLKLKIPKEKLNLSAIDGIRIKIPKDKIKGSLYQNISTFSGPGRSETQPSATGPPPALKIKISKDRIENYSHSIPDNSRSSLSGSSAHHGHASNSSSGTGGTNNSSSSGKKKDRDRERDKDKKEKKRSSGSGSSSKTSSSKVQQKCKNMSQLFGESNDDDDDDDDDDLLDSQRKKFTFPLHQSRLSDSSTSTNSSRYSTTPNNMQQQQQQQQQQQPQQLQQPPPTSHSYQNW